MTWRWVASSRAGVDSSYVSTYFADQKTFTVGLTSGENTTRSAGRSASEKIGVDHHYKVISSEEFWDSIEGVQNHMDQPLADPSCIALYFVSKLASRYVKVVLSGEGADELFGSYTIYNEPRVFKWYQRLLPACERMGLARLVKKVPFHFVGQSFIIRGSRKTEISSSATPSCSKEEKQKLLKDPPWPRLRPGLGPSPCARV